jgi:hypothetical protein
VRYQIHKVGATWVEGRLRLTEAIVRLEKLPVGGCVVALHAFPRRDSLRVLETLKCSTDAQAATAYLPQC